MMRVFTYLAVLPFLGLAFLGLALLATYSCSKEHTSQPLETKAAAISQKPSVPAIRVTPSIQANAQEPRAGSKAGHKNAADTFGRGKATITVKGHPDGVDHSFWAEQLDIDGSGNPVQVDEAWDNRHKVLYVSKDRAFTCDNGQMAQGSTLMAVYGKGNTLNKPTGSGWWVADLNRGQCAVQTADVYGCRFDAEGKNTDCGSANVKSDEDDVVIVPFPKAGSGESDHPTEPSGNRSTGSPAAPPVAPSEAPPADPGRQEDRLLTPWHRRDRRA